jgi:hypothetical protein
MPKGQNSDINAKNNNNTNFDGERKNNEKNNKDNDLKIIDSDNLSNIPKEELEDNSDRDLNRTLSYLQILFYYDCEQIIIIKQIIYCKKKIILNLTL